MDHTKTCPQCGKTYGDADRFCTVDGAALVSASGASLVGTVVADRFLVMEKLGEGGMGEVYLAEHVRMKRKVALKLMRPWMLGDPVAVGRFHREAENASQISHPNVAQVYDFGETAERVVYLAMEFVDGEPLSAILQREGKLHTVRTAEIVRQVAEALFAAHSMGILHRDLKPDNVMVGRSRAGTDLVKLVDFGIARAMHRGTQQFTSTGLVVGTPDYMSPEQLSGDELDGRSDLYALALMAFRMLTGTPAYPEGGSGEAMVARLTSPPRRLAESLPGVAWPAGLQAAFDKALAPDPRERYADTMEFVAELDAAVQGMPLSEEEQQYMVALSQRHPTPVRGGNAIPTPVRATGAVRAETPMPMSAVLTPPAQPRVDRPVAPIPEEAAAMPAAEIVRAEAPSPMAASPLAGLPRVIPVAEEPEPARVPAPVADSGSAPAATGRRGLIGAGIVGVLAIAGYLLSRGGGAPGGSAADTAVRAIAPLTPPAAAAPDSAKDVAPAAAGATTDSTLLVTTRRATLALWSSAGTGAAVLADSSGIALTAASLVPTDSVVGVFLDANTQVKATVLTVDRASGLATLLLPVKRCTRCAFLAPDAGDPTAGDSVFILPARERGDGTELRTAIATFDGRSLTVAAPPRSATGAPVVSRRTQRLVALGGRKFATPTALRDAVVAAKAKARGVTPSEAVIPIWPDRPVPASALADDQVERAKTEVESYREQKDGLRAVFMTPQLMKVRADLNDNPLVIPADPIRAWAAFGAYRKRPVVVINGSSADASFPKWPTKDVDFKRGDVKAVHLFRNDTLVTPIEVGTFPALTANGKKAIPSSAVAVYSALEFKAGDSFRVVLNDAKGGDVTIPLRPGTLEAVRRDFAWLFAR